MGMLVMGSGVVRKSLMTFVVPWSMCIVMLGRVTAVLLARRKQPQIPLMLDLPGQGWTQRPFSSQQHILGDLSSPRLGAVYFLLLVACLPLWSQLEYYIFAAGSFDFFLPSLTASKHHEAR